MKLNSFNFLILGKLIALALIASSIIFVTQAKVTWNSLWILPSVPSVAKLPPIETVSLASALMLFHREGTVFLDVRESRYYTYGHIHDALNWPPERMTNPPAEHLLTALRNANSVIIYCNGVSCGLVYTAANKLRELGLETVKVYPEGWPEWRNCRLPMTMSKQMKEDVKRLGK
jgi:rhodanese-related sulfurtransferase